MVGSIGPMVRDAKTAGAAKWLRLFYLLASVGGGLVLGLLMAAVAVSVEYILSSDSSALLVFIGVLSFMLGLGEVGLASVGYPTTKRQVPSEWRYTRPPSVTAGLYGFELGLGFTTIIVSPMYHTFLLGSIAVLDGRLAIAAGAVYGLVRGTTVLRAISRCGRFEGDLRFLAKKSASERTMKYLYGLAILCLSTSLVVQGALGLLG